MSQAGGWNQVYKGQTLVTIAGAGHEVPLHRPRQALIMGVFGWLQADTVAAVWTAAAAIHREKNTVEAAAAAGLQPQQAAANKLYVQTLLAE
jgi:hypothetical protein